MASIAITGAAGEVGRRAITALADRDPTLLTHREHDDLDSVVLDVRDGAAFADALDGEDVLVHLAWGPADEDGWNDEHAGNVEGTYNAFEAALANDVDRVIVGSSNHVCHMGNTDDPTRMESLAADARPVRPDEVRPDSYYGVAKAAVEAFGSYYADRHGIEVVTLRIGWLMSRAELREKREAPPPHRRFASAMWLSHRDCRAIIRRAVEADLPENPLTVNAVSRNADRTLSLTEALRGLGYRPRDDASEVLDASEA